jgi:hypothetical protein
MVCCARQGMDVTGETKNRNKDIWFPAKKIWCWMGISSYMAGVDCVLSYLIFLFAGVAALSIFPITIIAFVVYVLILTGLLFFICWKKGEKIDFCWGKKEK